MNRPGARLLLGVEECPSVARHLRDQFSTPAEGPTLRRGAGPQHAGTELLMKRDPAWFTRQQLHPGVRTIIPEGARDRIDVGLAVGARRHYIRQGDN